MTDVFLKKNIEMSRSVFSDVVCVACYHAAVMALERVPADIRKDGGVARMSDPEMIKAIKAAVTIPVMAKVLSHPRSAVALNLGI